MSWNKERINKEISDALHAIEELQKLGANPDKKELFLKELTALSHKFGLCIEWCCCFSILDEIPSDEKDFVYLPHTQSDGEMRFAWEAKEEPINDN